MRKLILTGCAAGYKFIARGTMLLILMQRRSKERRPINVIKVDEAGKGALLFSVITSVNSRKKGQCKEQENTEKRTPGKKLNN